MTDLHPFDRLTPDVVMDAVESVGYRCDARILELNSYENRVYQIGIEDTVPVIGKFYRPGRWTNEQILEEHVFTTTLEEMDVSAVAPLVLKGGQEGVLEGDGTLKQHLEFRFALYPRRGGRAPELDSMENLETLGRHIGRIHAVGAGEKFRFRPSISLAEYGEQSSKYLLDNNFIPNELRTNYQTIRDTILKQLADIFTPFRFIRLHGDCHMGNVLWRDDLPHFVDFDDARNGPAIQDLWMMLSGDESAQSVQMSAILRGYTAFYEFDRSELRLIEPLRTLRMMYHAAWVARRWDDPAFPRAFTFFNTQHYWSNHLLELSEQLSRMAEPPLALY